MSLPNVPSEELFRLEPQCPICAQSAPNLNTEDSDLEEEDWNGDIEKVKEEGKQKNEDQLRRKFTAEQCTNGYYPQAHNTDHPMEKTPLTSKIDHHIITKQSQKKKEEKD